MYSLSCCAKMDAQIYVAHQKTRTIYIELLYSSPWWQTCCCWNPLNNWCYFDNKTWIASLLNFQLQTVFTRRQPVMWLYNGSVCKIRVFITRGFIFLFRIAVMYIFPARCKSKIMHDFWIMHNDYRDKNYNMSCQRHLREYENICCHINNCHMMQNYFNDINMICIDGFLLRLRISFCANIFLIYLVIE